MENEEDKESKRERERERSRFWVKIRPKPKLKSVKVDSMVEIITLVKIWVGQQIRSGGFEIPPGRDIPENNKFLRQKSNRTQVGKFG